jgi:hypothetical protein
VSLARRYLLGVAAVAVAGAVAVLLVPAAIRPEVIWGAATGLVLQVPLGWWALRSLGTDHFMVSWGLGMLVRFTVVAVAGLAVLPATGRSPAPMLGTMVAVLLALLFVEGHTAAREHSREDER